MSQFTSKRLSLCVAGMGWPPETFLTRLLGGLIDAGVDVTIACARDPTVELEGVRWLSTPSWDDSWLKRVLDVGIATMRGRLKHPKDYLEFQRNWGSIATFSSRLQSQHKLGPFIGKRWDVLYFPWVSSAVGLLPTFVNARSVVLS